MEWSVKAQKSKSSSGLELMHLLAQNSLDSIAASAHLNFPMSHQDSLRTGMCFFIFLTFFSTLSMAGAQSTFACRSFHYALPLTGIINPIHTQRSSLTQAY